LMHAQALQMSSPPQAHALQMSSAAQQATTDEFLQSICAFPEAQQGSLPHLTPSAVSMQPPQPAEARDTEMVVGYVLPSQRPTVEVIDEQEGSTCSQMLARVLCCLSCLLLAAAGLLVAKHHGHIHIPRHLPHFHGHHLLGPWRLPIVMLSAAMLCIVAALINVCRPQSHPGNENGQSLHRSKYLGGAACACFSLGMTLVGLVCLAMSPGGSHLVHHMMHFLQAGRLHPAVHLIFMICLFVGMLSFVASVILYVRKVSNRRDARTLANVEHDRHSSCGKRALIALLLVLGLLLIKGVSHGSLHLPMHIPGFRPNFHGHHGPQEWQNYSDLDSEGEGEENEGFEADDGSDYAEDEKGEADDSEDFEASDNSDYAEDQEEEGDDSEGLESDDGSHDDGEGEARQQTGVQSAEQNQVSDRKEVTTINREEPMARKKMKMNTKMTMKKTIETRKAEAISRTSIMV